MFCGLNKGMKYSSFKQYLEFIEVKPSYINKVSDELGIAPKTMEDSPQWAANLTLGKVTLSGTTYSFRYVRNGHGDITGAMIKPMDQQRAYMKKDDKMIRMSSPPEAQETFVSKDQIEKMLTQGQDAAAGTGAGGAMPPGAM